MRSLYLPTATGCMNKAVDKLYAQVYNDENFEGGMTMLRYDFNVKYELPGNGIVADAIRLALSYPFIPSC